MANELEFEKTLSFQTTTIPGLLIGDIPVHGDSRGWFKENYQKEKMAKLGLPDFDPIQNNISFNIEKGATRGIHAEPWDKFISIGLGRVFGAWVDLREGDSFGSVFTAELDPTKAIFVPRGVGNAFQALEDNTVYTYLVNDHWSAEAQKQYTFLNLADKTVNINWPINLDKAELSDRDKNHPSLDEVVPMKPKRVLITGSNGQLGNALKAEFPNAEFTDVNDLDITDPNIENTRDWRQYSLIINTAAYTAVDKAETPDGILNAWNINAKAVANLSKLSTKNSITLVHISSDYVFDGSKPEHYEDEKFSPINVYGQSKAAGDIAASMNPNHYIIRTSWVIGDGKNFVDTMKSLAENDKKINVVDDQIGRLTFTSDLAKGIKFLVDKKAPFGTYNISNSGDPVSWSDIASEVYRLTGHNSQDVNGVSTSEYYADKHNIAPRPLQSTLNLDKITSAGFIPRDWREALAQYLGE